MRLFGPITQPLALSRDWLRGALEGLDLTALAERFAAERAKALFGESEEREEVELDVRDGVAVIDVNGPLFARETFWSWIFGGSSYEALGAKFDAAQADARVRAILLDANSPGGDVDGCSALARQIYTARGRKPMRTFARGTCASAMYWIGSATDGVDAEDTALLGSIGVIIPVCDDTKMLEKAGITFIDVVSEDAPGKRSNPLDDEVFARLQTIVNDTGAIFRQAVALHRSVTPAKVSSDFGRGDVMIAARAVAAGMADRVTTFDAVLAELAAKARETSATSTTTTKAGSSARPRRRPAMAKAMDETKPEDKNKAEKPKAGKCPDCEGSGKCDACGGSGEVNGGECPECKGDGKCEMCGGSGEVEVEEKEEPSGEAPADDEEKKAAKELRQRLGVASGATSREMLLAFRTRFTSSADVGALRQRLDQLEARDAERALREIQAQAGRAVDKAITEGRQESSKRDLLVEAYVTGAQRAQKAGKADAEVSKAGEAELERQLFQAGTFGKGGAIRELTRGGAPIGTPRGGGPGADPGDPVRRRSMPTVGSALVTRARELMAADPKLTFDEASNKAYAEDPSLYQ